MAVRRSDSRRRRIMANASTSPSAPPARRGAAPSCKQETETTPYTFGANRRSQPKTTDLFPKRFLACSLVVLGLLAAIGGLNLLANYSEAWRTYIGDEGVTALALSGHGTLSSWFSSFLLMISGFASLQLYALRQHRRDDYRGTYRLWFWLAGLLMLSSLNCVVDLTSIATHLLQSLAWFSNTSPPWLPIAIKLGLLTILVARGLVEVRESRGALALVLFVWVAYSASAVLQLPQVQPITVNLGQRAVLGNTVLFGTAGLLLALLTYVRFVYLTAHGLIQPRVKQTGSSPAASPSAQGEQKVAASKKTNTRKKATTSKAKTGSKADTKAKPKAKPKTKTPTKQAPVEPAPAAKKPTPKGTRKKSPEQQPQTAAPLPDATDSPQESENAQVLKMTKSQRRKKRRAERRRRAA